jgi:hypothetical protein
MYTNKVPSDSYFFIDTKWKGDFSHIVPCRGYNLKSQLKFNESIFWIESSNWYEVTKEQYEEHVYGRAEQAETQQENPPKRSRRSTKNKDSESARDSGKESTRTTRSQPSKLRESKVRNVRKPKKDVQGTNNSRKETPAGTRKPTGQTKQRTTNRRVKE